MRFTVVAVASALLVGGCATSKLDTSGAATKITDELRHLYPALKVGETSCPGHVQLGKGRTFTCTVLVDGQTVDVAVRQEDGHGKVSFRTTEYLLQPSVAAGYLRSATVQQLAARDQAGPGSEPQVEVSCGSAPLVLVPQPGSFRCSVTTPGGSYTQVGSVAADGTLTYSVPGPPATAPATPGEPAPAAPPATLTS